MTNITLGKLPDPRRMSDNIVRVYEEASEKHREEGLSWYAYAKEIAAQAVENKPYTTEQAAAVMAVISPKLSWALNARYPAFIADYHSAGLDAADWPGPSGRGLYVTMKVREKCIRILDGEDPRQFLGPKTGAFFANIMGDEEAVTVDRWAMRVALADRSVQSATGAALRKIAESYVVASGMLDATPAATQAICWTSYRSQEA